MSGELLNEWDRLIRQVELELAEMYDELAAVGPLLRVLNQREPDLVELRAVAATLHAFYNGVERIFTIIHKNLDRDGLAGHRWHRELLERMALARDNRRAVIDQELTDTLLNYLGFRHRFRHSYPGALHWNQMAGLVTELETTHNAFRESVDKFLTDLKGRS